MSLFSPQLLILLNDPDVEVKRLGLSVREQAAVWPILIAARCVLHDRLADPTPQTKRSRRALCSLERLAAKYEEAPRAAVGRREEILKEVADRVEVLPGEIRLYLQELRKRGTARTWMHGILGFCRNWREGPPLSRYLPSRAMNSDRQTRPTRRVRQLTTDIITGVQRLWATRRFRRCSYPSCWRFVAARTRDVFCSTCRTLPKPSRWRHSTGRVKKSRRGDSFVAPVVRTLAEFYTLSAKDRLRWFTDGGNIAELKEFRETGRAKR